MEAQATLHGEIFKGFLFNVDWPRNITVQRIPSPKAVPSCSDGGGGWVERPSLACCQLSALTAQIQLQGPKPSSRVLS